MMGKLLPCPFCGNEFPTITETQSKVVLIRCPQCNTTFSRDFYETGRGELGKQRTIEAWNRRAEIRTMDTRSLKLGVKNG